MIKNILIATILLLLLFALLTTIQHSYYYKVYSFDIENKTLMVNILKHNNTNYCIIIKNKNDYNIYIYDKINSTLFIPNRYLFNFFNVILIWEKDQLPGIKISKKSIKTEKIYFYQDKQYLYIKNNLVNLPALKIRKNVFD